MGFKKNKKKFAQKEKNRKRETKKKDTFGHD